ncbi:ead/Ea22-like family protein [Cronobacter dublinensis]
MNNTNELTAKLKAAAQGALQPHERLSAIPMNDIFDISLAEGTQLDADITAVNAFHDESTPAKILELIAALEAAQKRNAELEARTLRVHMPALRNAEMMSDLAWNSAIDHCFDALIKATDDAGINLETGGEA